MLTAPASAGDRHGDTRQLGRIEQSSACVAGHKLDSNKRKPHPNRTYLKPVGSRLAIFDQR
jgi:hypothetical protein